MMLKTPLLFAVAAAALAACAGVPSLENFPERAPAQGALLIRLVSDADKPLPEDFSLAQLNIRVYDKSVAPKKVAGSHHVTLASYYAPKCDELFLLALPPGRYSADVLAGVYRKEFHLLDLPTPAGAFADAVVEAGKVTVLGSLRLKVDVKASKPDTRDETESVWMNTSASGLTWDDSIEERRRIAAAAVADARTKDRGWLQALEAARAGLAR